MLTRLGGVLALLVGLLLLGTGVPGVAEPPPVECEVRGPDGECLVYSGGPGLPGTPPPGRGGGPGGGGSVGFTGCVGERLSPQPPPPAGQPTGGYAWYQTVCYANGVETSRSAPTWGSPAFDASLQPIDPAVLAAQAIASMTMLAPPIGMMPPQGSEGAITGVPVWLWVQPGVTTTGTNSASASAGGVTVTAVANVTEVTWGMGDGSVITCGIGTPYDPSYGGDPSPTCGHLYQVKSTKDDPSGVYTVTATSTWTIIWSGGGESGTEILELSSSVPLRVTEINVINVPGD